MTRDAYAKEVMRTAEAAFYRHENVTCPHEDCDEMLSVVQQSTFSTRSLFCPKHGHIFQEQDAAPFGKLDWDTAQQRAGDSQFAVEESEEVEEEVMV